MNIAVVGCGYVGLVSDVGLASVGHKVIGIETAEGRRREIEGGHAPFHEPGLEALLRRVLAGNFSVTGDMTAISNVDVVLLAVQTPALEDGSNDLSFLRAAAGSVVELWRDQPDRDRVLVTRSTVVPGTAERLVRPLVESAGLNRVAVASNPEFLREGSAISDFLSPDRVVVGCNEEWGVSMLRKLYAPLDAPFVTTVPATAELAKYTSNAFLATLVSFSNEIATVCEQLPGVDVEDVLAVLHMDRRLQVEVGGKLIEPEILSYLKAGCGFGGSCLPKDISALISVSMQLGDTSSVPLLEAVRSINEGRAARLVSMAEEAIGPLKGRRVAVLGAAFKSGTDDLRESPGLKITEELVARDANVVIYDPLVSNPQLRMHVDDRVQIADELSTVLEADAILVSTNAAEFSDLHGLLADRDRAPVVIDGRRHLDPAAFHTPYLGVGRGLDSPKRPGRGALRNGGQHAPLVLASAGFMCKVTEWGNELGAAMEAVGAVSI